jgi:hypothetical protein
VGIYTRLSDVNDPLAMLEEFREGFRKYPFLREIFPFNPDIYTVIEDFDQELKFAGFQPILSMRAIEERKPKLHLKMNFFASAELRNLLSQKEWEGIFRMYLHYRENFMMKKEGYVEVRNIPKELRELFNLIAQTYWESLSGEEKQRSMYYLTVGSHNQDYRGIIMDGEVACVVSGYHGLIAMLDMFFMTGLTTWVEDLQALEELLPAFKGLKRRLGRYLMKVL